MMAGMNVPGSAKEVPGCAWNLTKTQCDHQTPEEWDKRCRQNNGIKYLRHSWAERCGDVYGSGGCEYVCERL